MQSAASCCAAALLAAAATAGLQVTIQQHQPIKAIADGCMRSTARFYSNQTVDSSACTDYTVAARFYSVLCLPSSALITPCHTINTRCPCVCAAALQDELHGIVAEWFCDDP
jgi:hypothetical protein